MSANTKALARGVFRLSIKLIPSSILDRLLPPFLREVSESKKLVCGVPTVAGVLENTKKNGFHPKTVIDIGAYVGNWSRMAARLFPSARFFLIDGNPEHEKFLQKAQLEIPAKSDLAICLLGPQEKGDVVFYQLDSGSSVLPELTTYQKKAVHLPMQTLDQFLASRPYELPVLLKLDVQGFELEVLRGGLKTLAAAEVVILETSLLPYNEGAPLFPEVVGFMAEAGFAVYDFCGQFRRETDQTLFQTDVVFVRNASELRKPQKFWLAEP
jgi:FkbM family methyltransferase